MAGRYTGSYLDRSNGWRAVATLADIGRASLVGRIPKGSIRTLPGRRQQDRVLIHHGRRSSYDRRPQRIGCPDAL